MSVRTDESIDSYSKNLLAFLQYHACPKTAVGLMIMKKLNNNDHTVPVTIQYRLVSYFISKITYNMKPG